MSDRILKFESILKSLASLRFDDQLSVHDQMYETLEGYEPPESEEMLAELDRRIRHIEEHPEDLIPLEQAKAELEEKRKQFQRELPPDYYPNEDPEDVRLRQESWMHQVRPLPLDDRIELWHLAWQTIEQSAEKILREPAPNRRLRDLAEHVIRDFKL
jgi:predicted nuclease with TOPRIM domain